MYDVIVVGDGPAGSTASKVLADKGLPMKQRLAIALAVMHDPELLILDEPINGLDPIGLAEVRSFIRALCDERGKTILISSHQKAHSTIVLLFSKNIRLWFVLICYKIEHIICQSQEMNDNEVSSGKKYSFSALQTTDQPGRFGGNNGSYGTGHQ